MLVLLLKVSNNAINLHLILRRLDQGKIGPNTPVVGGPTFYILLVTISATSNWFLGRMMCSLYRKHADKLKGQRRTPLSAEANCMNVGTQSAYAT